MRVYRDDFVAGGEDGDTRFFGAAESGGADLRGESQFGVAEARAAVKQRLIFGGFAACGDDILAGRGGLLELDLFRRSRWVCSIMTTASAPGGMAAPVMICMQDCGSSGAVSASPALISPMQRSVAPAIASEARTA